jgi:hypothetical protein
MAPSRVQRQLSNLGSSMWALGEAEPFLDTVINGLLYLDTQVELSALRTRVGEVFAVHPRFRMVVRHREGSVLEWDEPAEALDLAYHVRDVTVPSASGTATQAEVDAYIGSKYGELLDKERPLWLVERVVNVGAVGPERKSKGLLVLRLHHVIGDGISLTAFVMGLFDQDGGAVGIEGASAATGKQLQQDAGTSGDASSAKSGAVRWPRRSALLAALHHARLVVLGVLEGLLFVALPGDSATMLHAPITSLGHRKVVSSPVVPLQRIKDIKDAVGATVNDVLVAALAGAVRAYLQSHGSAVGPKLRAGCLLNMRSAAETKKLQALRGSAVPLSNQVGSHSGWGKGGHGTWRLALTNFARSLALTVQLSPHRPPRRRGRCARAPVRLQMAPRRRQAESRPARRVPAQHGGNEGPASKDAYEGDVRLLRENLLYV